MAAAGGVQVCALQWSRHEREILSSHGFSKNQLCLWKYPSMAKAAELTGHTVRGGRVRRGNSRGMGRDSRGAGRGVRDDGAAALGTLTPRPPPRPCPRAPRQARALHMAQSPDGASVVTAGADETLRFWRVFGDPPAKQDKAGGGGGGAGGASSSMMRSVNIR